jgi:hypothetical protein
LCAARCQGVCPFPGRGSGVARWRRAAGAGATGWLSQVRARGSFRPTGPAFGCTGLCVACRASREQRSGWGPARASQARRAMPGRRWKPAWSCLDFYWISRGGLVCWAHLRGEYDQEEFLCN